MTNKLSLGAAASRCHPPTSKQHDSDSLDNYCSLFHLTHSVVNCTIDWTVSDLGYNLTIWFVQDRQSAYTVLRSPVSRLVS
ncbi:hypothetical protein NXS19_013453 [Fusarium pseudograminearum]|nr:hypothetical protein NXS19_013453 [Fusarium pseudograminearum]